MQSLDSDPSGCILYRGAVTSLKGMMCIFLNSSFSIVNLTSLFLQSRSTLESAIGTQEESAVAVSSFSKYPLTLTIREEKNMSN